MNAECGRLKAWTRFRIKHSAFAIALTRRLRRYTTPTVLLVDEVGYLSYDSRAADLLFGVVSRRHEQRSIILTTNKPFAEWNEVFPNGQETDGHGRFPRQASPRAYAYGQHRL